MGVNKLVYNLTGLNNVTNVYTYVAYMNTETNTIMAMLVITIIMLAVFARNKQEDTVDNLILTSFLGMILSGLLLFAGLLNWWFVMIPIGLLFISMLVKFFS